MKKRVISILLALVLCLSLCGCGGNVPAQEHGDTAYRTYTDDCGREVEIPESVTRIVASGGLSQIALFAIAPDLLVGLASEWKDSARGVIGEEYLSLPYFGELYDSADLNVEELALASPQLVIDVGEQKPSSREDMDSLETQTNIPSVHIDAALKTMPEAFRKLGALLGREEKGEELAQFCERIYSRTEDVMARVGDDRVSALYVLGDEGLNVIAKGAYHAELIDLLTDNLAVIDSPSSKGLGNEVTMEQLALWDPEFIIFGPRSIFSDVSSRPAWEDMRAISAGNYIETPESPLNWLGTPPGAQRYLGLIWLPSVLYPEYCDYDVQADILEFYRLFYHAELSDAQYEALTENAFVK